MRQVTLTNVGSFISVCHTVLQLIERKQFFKYGDDKRMNVPQLLMLTYIYLYIYMVIFIKVKCARNGFPGSFCKTLVCFELLL